MSEQTTDWLKAVAKILLRCWIFGFVLLAIWFGVALLMGETIHQLHGPMFGITSHELDILFYSGMGILKLFVFIFFFIPWLSIRLVLKKTNVILI